MRMLLCSMVLIVLASSCSTGNKIAGKSKDQPAEAFDPDFRNPGPQAIVYKTKKNYDSNVAIILSADGSEIVSYPAPSDINPKTALPFHLQKGYLLDNRGIEKNVAFLSITYADYARLPKAPTKEELYRMIIDKNPLKEMCNCGNRRSITNPETALNYLITAHKLRTICKVLK